MNRLATRLLGEGSFYAAVIALVTFAAFPFYWMLITTFKTDGDLYNLKSNPYWFNAAPTLEHIRTCSTTRCSCSGSRIRP
jgi:multiple sugar transport system permease protein